MKAEITFNSSFHSLMQNIEGRLAEAVRAGAETVRSGAAAVCPVDTGALRDSITVESDGNSAVVSANTDYAAFVEFGTSKMAPQPYLVPALIENSQAVLSSIADVLTSMQGV